MRRRAACASYRAIDASGAPMRDFPAWDTDLPPWHFSQAAMTWCSHRLEDGELLHLRSAALPSMSGDIGEATQTVSRTVGTRLTKPTEFERNSGHLGKQKQEVRQRTFRPSAALTRAVFGPTSKDTRSR